MFRVRRHIYPLQSIGFRTNLALFYSNRVQPVRMSNNQVNRSRSSFTSVNITFLGTASAQPSSTRNHSSLALRLEGDVWLFDCGEATQHQIQKSSVKMGKIEKIFITHTHGEFLLSHVGLYLNVFRGPYFWTFASLGKSSQRRRRYC